MDQIEPQADSKPNPQKDFWDAVRAARDFDDLLARLKETRRDAAPPRS